VNSTDIIRVAANVTDFFMDEVIARIFYPNGTIQVLNLTFSTVFNNTFTPSNVGPYIIEYEANDTLGNIASLNISFVSVGNCTVTNTVMTNVTCFDSIINNSIVINSTVINLNFSDEELINNNFKPRVILPIPDVEGSAVFTINVTEHITDFNESLTYTISGGIFVFDGENATFTPTRFSTITITGSDGVFNVSDIFIIRIPTPDTSSEPPDCNENWACESWTSCYLEEQTRTCYDSNNCGSKKNIPIEFQTCGCEEQWECTDWSACSDDISARFCIDVNECGTSNDKPIIEQTCVCEESWTCDDWGECYGDTVTRTCVDLHNCKTTQYMPLEEQACGVCVEDWDCTFWSDCSDDKQTRTCNDKNNCETSIEKPFEQIECIYCTEDWTCDGWGFCDKNGNQFRDCSDDNACGTDFLKPATINDCGEELLALEDLAPEVLAALLRGEITIEGFDANKFLSITDKKTGFFDVPCYSSDGIVQIEKTPFDDQIYLIEGRELAIDPLELTCSGTVQLSVLVPNYFEQFEVHICQGDECVPVGSRKADALFCDNSVVKSEITIDEPLPDVKQPENPLLRVITQPKQEDGFVTVSYEPITGIDESSLSLFRFVNERWVSINSTLNRENKTVSAEVDDSIVAIIGDLCVACNAPELKQVSDINSSTAVILVHGFASTPGTFQAMINDMTFTEQPYDVWTYGYSDYLHIKETGEVLSRSIEAQMNYDKIIIVGHSLGGLVTQYAIRDGHDTQKDFIEKVDLAILAGVPNQGAQEFKNIQYLTNFAANTGILQKRFNFKSQAYLDLLNFEELERVSSVRYVVISGDKPFELKAGPITISSATLLGINGSNDGLFTVKNTQTVGSKVYNDQCTNFWELSLPHTQLNNEEVSRTLILSVISDELQSKNPPKYLRVLIPSCQDGDILFVSGLKRYNPDLCILLQPSCKDGVQNQDEEGIDCGGVCGSCERFSPTTTFSIASILALLATLAYFYASIIKELFPFKGWKSKSIKTKMTGPELSTVTRFDTIKKKYADFMSGIKEKFSTKDRNKINKSLDQKEDLKEMLKDHKKRFR